MATEQLVVYLAAPFEEQAHMRLLRTFLHERDVRVSSTWLDEEGTGTPDDTTAARYALRDHWDIENSDALVLYSPPVPPSARGGSHWESGYAYRAGKPIVVYGTKANVFHRLFDVRYAANTDQLLRALRVIAAAKGEATVRVR